MPTQITVPVAERTKSIKFGAAYSPALTFNPDKGLLWACSGVLSGMDVTVDASPTPDTATVASGSFIQNGIIVTLTNPQVVEFPDPLPSVPLYLVAENQNEETISPVEILFTTAPAGDSVVIATWFTPISTTVFEQPQKISICEIRDTLDGIAKLVIQRHHAVATGGQTVFTLPAQNAYQVGANKLWVFRNGKKIEDQIDYSETSSTTVELSPGSYPTGATAGDFFEFITFKSAPPITSISLEDLTDVDTDLAQAIKDTSFQRVQPATAANPLATIEDVNAAVAAGSGGFQFAKWSAPVTSSVGVAGGVVVPGTQVSFTLTQTRPVLIQVTSGGFRHTTTGANGAAFIRVNGTDHQIGKVEGSDGGSSLVETGQCSGFVIVTLPAGTYTAELFGSGSINPVILAPIQLVVMTGEAI